MTHRPIGSVWRFLGRNSWKVLENVEDNSNLCALVEPSYLTPRVCTMYIKENTTCWELVSMPDHSPFTDKEYEELLV